MLNGVALWGMGTAQGGASEAVFVVTTAGLLAGGLLGGPGPDRLRGADQRNVWRGTSRNAGKLNGVGFGGGGRPTGGGGDGRVVFEGGGGGEPFRGGAATNQPAFSAHSPSFILEL